jgi:nitrate/nitrite-specific signal transduction histidine kinase
LFAAEIGLENARARLLAAAHCVIVRIQVNWRPVMPDRFGTATAAALEQCVDEIDDFVETLDHHPGSVIAMALRIHLAALLRAMLDDQICSRDEVREFLAALEREAIGATDL